MLHRVGRFLEMLDLCEAVTEKFPQTKPQRTRGDRRDIAWYIVDAKRERSNTAESKQGDKSTS